MGAVWFSQERNQIIGRMKVTGPLGSCFGWCLMGHQIRQRSDRRVSPRAGKEPGLCKRCRRGKHWTKECRSKRDNQENPLSGIRHRPRGKFSGQSINLFSHKEIYSRPLQNNPRQCRAPSQLLRIHGFDSRNGDATVALELMGSRQRAL